MTDDSREYRQLSIRVRVPDDQIPTHKELEIVPEYGKSDFYLYYRPKMAVNIQILVVTTGRLYLTHGRFYSRLKFASKPGRFLASPFLLTVSQSVS